MSLPKPAMSRPKSSAPRSAAACNLCRSQKMKCEGPNHAPCRRCSRAGVACIFGESQGKARQILWTKRTEQLEARLSRLESDLDSTLERVRDLEMIAPHLPSGLFDERHLLSLDLESPVDSLRRERKSPRTPSKRIRLDCAVSLLSDSSSNLQNIQQSASTRQKNQVADLQDEYQLLRHKVKSRFTKAIQAARPGPRRLDMVDRGFFSEEEAHILFELHRTLWAPQIPWLNLPDSFANVRLHSPLMLAVACSTGAKGSKNLRSYRRAKQQVIELVIDVLCYRFFAHDKPQSYQDVIAVIGCIVHCGLGLDPALVVDYAEHLRIRDVFDIIPLPQCQSESTQRQLLSIARTFVGVYIYTVLFSTLTAKPCVMKMNKSVLIMYCDRICQSPYSDKELDRNLKDFVDYYSLMEEAQIQLDSHYRLGSIDISERLATIEKYSALVQSWKRDLDESKTRVSLNAMTEFQLMYHRGMTYLACFATAESRDGRELLSNRRMSRLALQGVLHAVAILKEFINSRRAKPEVPCVHLEYKKSTMGIAAACILEACLLIPEYVQVSKCKRLIRDLTDEVEKQGGEWGGDTEDSYVTTLKALLEKLDLSVRKGNVEETSGLAVSNSSSRPGSKTFTSKRLADCAIVDQDNFCGALDFDSSAPAPPPLGDPLLSTEVLTKDGEAIVSSMASSQSIAYDAMYQASEECDSHFADILGRVSEQRVHQEMMKICCLDHHPRLPQPDFLPAEVEFLGKQSLGIQADKSKSMSDLGSLDYLQEHFVDPRIEAPGTNSTCCQPTLDRADRSEHSESNKSEEDGDNDESTFYMEENPAKFYVAISQAGRLNPSRTLLPSSTVQAAEFGDLGPAQLNSSLSEYTSRQLYLPDSSPHSLGDETTGLLHSLRSVYRDRRVQTEFQMKC